MNSFFDNHPNIVSGEDARADAVKVLESNMEWFAKYEQHVVAVLEERGL